MIYRIGQLFTFMFPRIKNVDLILANQALSGEEKEIFDGMSEYDKKHSIKVLKKVLKDDLLKDDPLYHKLALLHDCGKKKTTSLLDRMRYVVFKTNGSRIKYHPREGYDKLKDVDYKLALLVQKHHNNNIQNDKLKRFQKIDDRC